MQGAVTRRRSRSSESADKLEGFSPKRARLVGDTDPMNLQNGNAHAHHDVDVQERLGDKQLINRVEYIRLLEQALSALGFQNAAAQLERESGIALEPPTVQQLRSAIAAGAFDKAVALVGQLPLNNPAHTQQAQFLLLEQKYLEALEKRQTTTAVACLRTQLATQAPVGSTPRLHQLAACMLAATPAEMHAMAGWPPGSTCFAARHTLLQALQAIVPARLMVPERRLEGLVQQALEAQLAASLFHNQVAGPISLLTDYHAGVEQIPTRTTQVLEEHTDEVWHLAFSHDGTMLASGSRDGTACIWSVETDGSGDQQLLLRHQLRGHTGAVVFVAWSPDSTKLATCGNDGSLRVWSAAKGACSLVVKQHSAEVTAAVWLPDGQHIITASHDKNMHMHSASGELLRTWQGHRINDLTLTRNGRYLLATPAGDASVRIYQLDGDGEAVVRGTESIISICMASDSRHLLVHLANGRINLLQLPAEPMGNLSDEPVHMYDGPHPSARTGHWVIRSCFGGCNESFILSGSEECKVYVWHRGSGQLLAELEGHTGTVNAVAWNPVIHSMFASASDDRSIHVWGLSK